MSGSGRGLLVGLVGDGSGVKSNGVWMTLSTPTKLEKPDDGLLSDNGKLGKLVSGENGMWNFCVFGSVSGSVVGCFFLKHPELSLLSDVSRTPSLSGS